VARTIREQIRQKLNLTASAAVAPNKFLAMAPQRRFRLVGVGLSNFQETEDFAAQPTLFT
jgi:hypothetical protein